MSAGPEVSIIMPVRNEAASLDAALASVCSQATDASVEVIVVDDYSTDSSRSIIERWAARDEHVRLVSSPRRGIPQALNCGLEAARGRYLVRVDGHSIIPSDYVQALLDHIRSDACEGAGGHKRAVGQGPFGRAVAAAHGSRFGIGDSKYHYSQRQDSHRSRRLLRTLPRRRRSDPQGSRVGMRLAPHAALALGIMHPSWGTGFLVSVGRAALGRIPRFRRL